MGTPGRAGSPVADYEARHALSFNYGRRNCAERHFLQASEATEDMVLLQAARVQNDGDVQAAFAAFQRSLKNALCLPKWLTGVVN